jgi:UDP-N-acetylmuramyl tripeptide synthase
MSAGQSGASAFGATPVTDIDPETAQASREDRADALSEAAQAVKERYKTEKNKERKAALKAALEAAEDEAELARAEALKGSE